MNFIIALSQTIFNKFNLISSLFFLTYDQEQLATLIKLAFLLIGH